VASVLSNGNPIDKVQFYQGTRLLGEANSEPYSIVWQGIGAGSYSLTARAIYYGTNRVDSIPVGIQVFNPPPSVLLVSPTNNASYFAPATIDMAANVSPNGNSINQVQFYQGTTLIGQASSGPYSFSWTNVSRGNYVLSARALYNGSGSVDSAPVNVIVNGVPYPWQYTTVGSTSVAGNAMESNGTYTAKSAGALSGKKDDFLFVYQTINADGSVTARLRSVQNTGNNTRVGVMIRETLATGSRYSFMGASPDGAFRWQGRTSTGGSTSSSNSGSGSFPNVWLRVVRTGNTLVAYKSTNSTNWTQVDSRSITMSSVVYGGLVVASGNSSTLNTSLFDNVALVP
jgi:Bacterial Ig domain